MTAEDEPFIRRIVDSPGDDTPRLVYADWLDERGDPRGAYLRAEMRAANRSHIRRSKLATGLGPLWTAQVSRPPVGVCFRNQVLECTGPPLSLAEVEEYTNSFPNLSVEYIAFLLNYNGGLLRCNSCAQYGPDLSGFCSLTWDDRPRYNDGELATTLLLDELADKLYAPSPGGVMWSAEFLFTDSIPFGYRTSGFGHYNAFLLRPSRSAKQTTYRVYEYINPLGYEWSDMSDDEADDFEQNFRAERHLNRAADSLPKFLKLVDDAFDQLLQPNNRQ